MLVPLAACELTVLLKSLQLAAVGIAGKELGAQVRSLQTSFSPCQETSPHAAKTTAL